MVEKEHKKETKVKLESLPTELKEAPDPREVRSSNLEQLTAAAALEAAASLNKKYKKDVVEVTRSGVTLANDGGADIHVCYDKRIWESPGDFQKSFFPKLEGNLKS